jgi:hypothetical protein
MIQKLREFEVLAEVELAKEELKLHEVIARIEKVKVLVETPNYIPKNTVEIQLPLGIDSYEFKKQMEQYDYDKLVELGLAVQRQKTREQIPEIKATEMVDLGQEIAELKELVI